MTEFHTGRDIRLDTSDTHKYGEILIHSEKGEICTVHPIDENEDMPNFPLCHLIAAAPELYEALDNLIKTLSERGVELDCMSTPTPLINLLNTEKEEAVVDAARAS